MAIIPITGSRNVELYLKGFLQKLNFDIADFHLYIVEKGQVIPENGLSIVFDETSINSLRSLLENLNGKPKEISADLVMGKKNDSYHPLTYSTICYFFAQGNTVLCRTDAEQYEVNKKLYLLEAELLSRGFLRINKSVIINVIWIAEIIPWFGGKLLLKVKMIKDELEVSRNYVPAFKNFLGL